MSKYLEKQDRQGVRTPANLEQKYSFGKSFSEVMGIASTANRAAEEAKRAAGTSGDAANALDKKLDQAEIYSRLTGNGEAQGFHLIDGQIYYSPEYILNLSNYVIEEGASGDWFYRKWSNGVAECWKRGTMVAAVNVAVATTGFFGSGIIGEVLPTNLFTLVLDVNIQPVIWNADVINLPQVYSIDGALDADYVYQIQWKMMRSISADSVEFGYTCYVRGFWS